MAVNVERTLRSTRESSLPLYFTLPFFLRRENSPARTTLSLFATLRFFAALDSLFVLAVRPERKTDKQ